MDGYFGFSVFKPKIMHGVRLHKFQLAPFCARQAEMSLVLIGRVGRGNTPILSKKLNNNKW